MSVSVVGDKVWVEFLGKQKPGRIFEIYGDTAIVIFPTLYEEFYVEYGKRKLRDLLPRDKVFAFDA